MTAAHAKPPSLFREPGFALLWGGQTISEFGSMITYIALPIIAVTVLDASAFQVGLIGAVSTAAWLVVGLPAGAWVDRVRRRPVLVAADIVRAAALLTLPVAWLFDALTVTHLLIVAGVTGLFTVLFDVAYPVYLPSVVERDRLVDANAKMSASASAALVAGPGLGGVLIQAIGAPLAILVDAVTFVASALGLSRIRATEQVSEPVAGNGLRRDLIIGLRYVVRRPFPRTIALSGATANFALAAYDAVVFVFLLRVLDLDSSLVGVLFGLGAAGGLLGSVVSGWLARRYGDAVLIWAAPIVAVVGGLLIPLTQNGLGLLWFAVGQLLRHGSVAVCNVCTRAAVQAGSPPELLGRVGASIRLFSRGALPVGALTGGALATVLAPRLALLVLTFALIAWPLLVKLSPIGRVTRIEELTPVG